MEMIVFSDFNELRLAVIEVFKTDNSDTKNCVICVFKKNKKQPDVVNNKKIRYSTAIKRFFKMVTILNDKTTKIEIKNGLHKRH
jgi:hypothetical protein